MYEYILLCTHKIGKIYKYKQNSSSRDWTLTLSCFIRAFSSVFTIIFTELKNVLSFIKNLRSFLIRIPKKMFSYNVISPPFFKDIKCQRPTTTTEWREVGVLNKQMRLHCKQIMFRRIFSENSSQLSTSVFHVPSNNPRYLNNSLIQVQYNYSKYPRWISWVLSIWVGISPCSR